MSLSRMEVPPGSQDPNHLLDLLTSSSSLHQEAVGNPAHPSSYSALSYAAPLSAAGQSLLYNGWFTAPDCKGPAQLFGLQGE